MTRWPIFTHPTDLLVATGERASAKVHPWLCLKCVQKSSRLFPPPALVLMVLPSRGVCVTAHAWWWWAWPNKDRVCVVGVAKQGQVLRFDQLVTRCQPTWRKYNHRGPWSCLFATRHALILHTRVSGDTHAHTHAQLGESVELIFCFFPSWRPPPGTARSSGRPAMRRPGTKSKCSVLSWSGTGLMSFCSFCMFLLLGFYGGPWVTRGEHANSTQKGPGTSPNMLHDAGLEPTTFLL